MVGGPGSGKSTYATSKLPTYKLVSNEQLKTKQNCIKALKEHLAAGDSVVIDNTNASVKLRSEYIAVAKASRVPIRCFYM